MSQNEESLRMVGLGVWKGECGMTADIRAIYVLCSYAGDGIGFDHRSLFCCGGSGYCSLTIGVSLVQTKLVDV